MPTTRFERFLPIAGILFAVLVVAGMAVLLETPGVDDSPAQVLAYWTEHEGAAIGSAVAVHMAAIMFVFFAAGLRSALRSGEAREATYSAVAFGGALLAAAGFALDGMLSAALASAANQDSEGAVYALYQIYGVNWMVSTVGLTVMLVATGLGGLRTLALGKRLSWAAILLGALFATPASLAGFFLLPIWAVVTSVVLVRRLRGEERRPVTAPQPA